MIAEIEFQASHNALEVCTQIETIEKVVFTLLWLQLFGEKMETKWLMPLMRGIGVMEIFVGN